MSKGWTCSSLVGAGVCRCQGLVGPRYSLSVPWELGGSPGLASILCSGRSFRMMCWSSLNQYCAAGTWVATASECRVWASWCNGVSVWLHIFCHPEVPRLSLSELGRDCLFGYPQAPTSLHRRPPQSLRYNWVEGFLVLKEFRGLVCRGRKRQES